MSKNIYIPAVEFNGVLSTKIEPGSVYDMAIKSGLYFTKKKTCQEFIKKVLKIAETMRKKERSKKLSKKS